MTNATRLALGAASWLLLSGAAMAQANGPITGIPSGIGANGSEKFTAAPQPQINTGIGAVPGAGVVPSASARPHVAHPRRTR